MVNKSVVTSFADPFHADQINSHPVVKHVLKAICLASTKEKKSSIWDVNALVSWLKSHSPDSSSLFQVSRHLAILLLVASGRRIHDLTLLSIDSNYFQEFDSYIILWPKFGSKTDSGSHKQSGWKISKNKDHNLDVYYWLKVLISLSKYRRSASPSLDSLFVSTRGNVRAATRAVIAGWVKTALKEIGVNDSPGSIRSAVGSSRFSLDMPLDEILKKGNWRNNHNFLKFYCKTVERNCASKEDVLPASCFEAV